MVDLPSKRRQRLQVEVLRALALDPSLAQIARDNVSTMSLETLDRLARQLRIAEAALTRYFDKSTDAGDEQPAIDVIIAPDATPATPASRRMVLKRAQAKAARARAKKSVARLGPELKKFYDVRSLSLHADVSKNKAEMIVQILERHLRLLEPSRHRESRQNYWFTVQYVAARKTSKASSSRLAKLSFVQGRKRATILFGEKASKWLANKIVKEVGVDRAAAEKAISVALHKLKLGLQSRDSVLD